VRAALSVEDGRREHDEAVVKMIERWRTFIQLLTTQERGATALEYAIMAALIGAVIVATVSSIGAETRDMLCVPINALVEDGSTDICPE
jgi:Flp pilus assembly pilin Flp